MNGENVADLAKILSALADLIGMWGANYANAASNEEIHYKADAFEITMARAKSAQWAINDRAVAEIAEQERMERVHERLAEVRAERARRERGY